MLRTCYPDWGRQAVQQTITAGKVRVNGRIVWLCSWHLRNGDTVTVTEPPPPKPLPSTEFDMAWLIADDGDILAVNKPAGLLSEPANAPEASNLFDLARRRFGELTLFHRLDRDTSGVLLLTRPGPINKLLTVAFQTHVVQKEYLAVVSSPNQLAQAGVITVRLAPDPRRQDRMVTVERGGQPAITRYAIVASSEVGQLVRLWPQTGRMHQLRVHLAFMGAPILGDRLYGELRSASRLMLHARRIQLPVTADDLRSYSASLPDEFLLRDEENV